MTPQAIRDGFSQLRSDEQMLGLADAARSRSEADWLVGINGTRAMTAFNSRDGGFFLTTVGRVQTPTLSIVVEREEKIRKHVPRDYWEIKATFGAAAGEYDGKWFDPKFKKNDDADRRADRVWSEAEANAILPAVQGPVGRGHRRGQAQQPVQPAAVRPDHLAARGQLALRLQRQDHAEPGPGAVRKAQGPDLPADRLARAARGLPGHGQADLRDDRRGRPARPAEGAGAARRARA